MKKRDTLLNTYFRELQFETGIAVLNWNQMLIISVIL